MSILEMINIWKAGCSCAEVGQPFQCQECTLELIKSIETHVTNAEKINIAPQLEQRMMNIDVENIKYLLRRRVGGDNSLEEDCLLLINNLQGRLTAAESDRNSLGQAVVSITEENSRLTVDRDQLRAKLSELENAAKGQEHIGIIDQYDDDVTGGEYFVNFLPDRDLVIGSKVYAAPIIEQTTPAESVPVTCSDEIGVQLYEEMQYAINDYCVANILPFSVIHSWEIIFEHWLATKDLPKVEQVSGSDARHPIQPLLKNEHGLLRFKENKIVTFLLDNGPNDMNKLAVENFSNEDREQFAQLIGYSLRGFGELSYVSDDTYNRAEQSLHPSPNKADDYWQPIETAPKNGRDLIILNRRGGFPVIAFSNTWWTSGFSVENKPQYWASLPPLKDED